MLQSVFLTKLRTLGILFSTAVILSISPLTSFILALRVVLVSRFVISDILSSIFLILALYTFFLTTSFLTTLLSLLKATKTGTNLSISNLSTLLSKLVHFSIYQYLIYLHEILG